MLPMKFVRRWAWENVWLVFSIVSLVILPWILAFSLVPNVLDVYASQRPEQFIVPFGFGFGWGIAQVLFGLSVARLGLALGYAVIIGLGASLGTLVPLFVDHRDLVATSKGALVLSGVAIMIDSPEKAAQAGREFRRACVDLLFLHVTTYALSSTVLPVVRQAKVPVIVLNLSPGPAIDYDSFNAMTDRGRMISSRAAREYRALMVAGPIRYRSSGLRATKVAIAFHKR